MAFVNWRVTTLSPVEDEAEAPSGRLDDEVTVEKVSETEVMGGIETL